MLPVISSKQHKSERKDCNHMVIKNGYVFTENATFEKRDVCLEDEYIIETTHNNDTEKIDADGLYVIPGLIDTHFHGCVGYDFCDGTNEAIQAIADYQAKSGITSIAPATMTLGNEDLEKIFTCAAAYESNSGAELMGIHMEGPYLSHAKKGAQNAAYLRSPDISHFLKMNELAKGLIKIVSIAPEEPGASNFISELKDNVVISVAHTTANYSTAKAAFEDGASHVTHLYNAMPPCTHREPGVIGAAFDDGYCKVELISDGIHIDPTMIRATFKLFGDDRIILISDSMMATGLTDGDYSLGGQPVKVKGNLATLESGTIAGSATNLMDCMRRAVTFGIPLTSAVKCATINPAKEIGVYHKVGSISPGKYANLVLLDKELNIVSIILKGTLLK